MRNKSILGPPRRSVLSVVLLAAALRLYHLGAESLWIDEGYSLRDAAGANSLRSIRPLYFYMLHWWMRLGDSESWLRLPSAIFGIGAVALLYLVGRRIYGHKVGLMASLILAVSPLHVNHSQEIRMYSLATLLVIAEVLFFIRYVEAGRTRDLIACLALAAAAFLAFPLTAFMLAVFNLFFLARVRRRAESIRWYASQCAIGLAAIPLVPAFVRVTRDYGEAWTWRMAKPGVPDIVRVMRDFNLWRIPPDHRLGALVGGAYAVFVLALAAYGVARAYKGVRWQTLLVALWLAVPLVGTAVASNVLANMWLTRYMIYASPAYYLLTALGLSAIPGRRLFWMALAAVLALPMVRLGSYYGKAHRPEWRQAVRYIERHLEEGDAIALYRYGNRYSFDYYYSGRAPWVALGQTRLTRSSFGGWSDRRIAGMMSAIPPGRRVWFVLSYHEDTGGFSIERYIRSHYRVLATRDFVRIRVYLAAPKGSRLPPGNSRAKGRVGRL